MDGNQLELARRLVAHPRWRWVAGMRITGEFGHALAGPRTRLYGRLLWANSGEPSMVEWQNAPDAKKTWTMETARMVGLKPDLEDYGTASILLRMAIEAGAWIEDWKSGDGWRLSNELYTSPRVLIHPVIEIGTGEVGADLGTVAATALLAAWPNDE